ncbi:MAG: hypothetical protein ABSA43_02510 [Candidatus Microgenomates bacterium]
MNKYLTRFKSLPVDTKRIFTVGMILAFAVALPLSVTLLSSQNFDIRNHAQSLTPEAIATSSPIDTGVPLLIKIALGTLIFSLILIVIGIKRSRSVVK